MSKKEIQTELKRNNKTEINIKTQAIIQNNIIKYIENNIINIEELKEEKITRRTKEYIIILDLKK